MITTILLIAACACFLGAVVNMPAGRQIMMLGLGGFFLTLSMLLGGMGL